jgi:AcrR family transcriptional regulator
MGRPRGEVAVSHTAILDAVYAMLMEGPAHELTMEAVAKRAKVGKPTLYRWWPSKAALILAMFHDRLGGTVEVPKTATAEKALRVKMKFLIGECNGLFGKVMADLIAEGQGDPSILKDLYENHIRGRRATTIAEIERGMASGELSADADPELLMDAMFGPVYLRLLMRSEPLTEAYGNELIDQALRGVRMKKKGSAKAAG